MPQSNQDRLIPTDHSFTNLNQTHAYVSPRNGDLSMSSAIRFAPRSPKYNQVQGINSPSQRIKPIIIRSPNRFNSHQESRFINTPSAGYNEVYFDQRNTTLPHYGGLSGNGNSHSSNFQEFNQLDSHPSSINRNVIEGGFPNQFSQYSDQINQYSDEISSSPPRSFSSPNNQHNSPNRYDNNDNNDNNDNDNNYGSDSDRESSLQILEEDDEER